MANAGYDLDDTPTAGGNRNPKPGELVDIAELSNKYQSFRLEGKVFAYGMHWVTTKKRDGSKTSFPTACLSFDPATGRRDSTKKCPWCSYDGKEIRFTVDFYTNALSRKKMKSAPDSPDAPTKAEIKSGFKIKDSDTFTPYVALRMPQQIVRSVKGLRDLNVHEDPSSGESMGFAVSHPKFGCDVSIKKDPDAPPASRYSVQKLDSKPLSKLERSFLKWDLSDLVQVPTLEEAQKEFKDWAKRMNIDVSGGGSDDDDDDDTPRKKRRPSDDDDDDMPKKKSRRPSDDDDDDMPPARKRKAVVDDDDDDDDTPKKKRKVVVDDDDDDEPVPKKKRKPVEDDDDDDDTPRRKRKPAVDDDDDDEVPAPKRRRPPVDDDDDDDDEPAPKKKRPAVDDDDDDDDEPAPKKKPKRPVDDDDDDDVPVRKKASRPSDDDDDDEPTPKKKRRKVVEDDDDDDIPF